MPNKPSSHRGATTERAVLIPLLLAERPHTQRELARICEVDTVTIRRLIDQLSLHHPIESRREGREVKYSYLDGYRYTPPSFTAPELSALLLAQQSIAATGLTLGAPFAAYGRVLLQKVRAALPATVRDKLDALSTIFGSAAVPAKDYSSHAATIDQLTSAAIAHRRVKLVYHSLNDDQIKERLFDPYAVYFDPDGATLKLIGYDHGRQAVIPLSIDRIRALTATPDAFTLHPSYESLPAFLTEHCFNGIHGEVITVRLRAYGITARIFAERTFHPSQTEIERTAPNPAGEESLTIELRVARGRGLERFILSWSPDVEVLAPPELRTRIATLHEQARARHTLPPEK